MFARWPDSTSSRWPTLALSASVMMYPLNHRGDCEGAVSANDRQIQKFNGNRQSPVPTTTIGRWSELPVFWRIGLMGAPKYVSQSEFPRPAEPSSGLLELQQYERYCVSVGCARASGISRPSGCALARADAPYALSIRMVSPTSTKHLLDQ